MNKPASTAGVPDAIETKKLHLDLELKNKSGEPHQASRRECPSGSARNRT
jgi:hypothetical protein